jgi:Cys-tRNA(Pro) deacylase
LEPLTPQDVDAAIKANGLDIELRTFDDSTATSIQAAENIGTPLGSIVKSLVFMVEDKPIVVLTSGDQTVDDRKIAAIYGVGRKKVKIAKPEQCIEHIGYAPGGVPPFGHRTKVPIYVDETLDRFELVYAAGGSPNTIFPIAFSTLVEKTGGIITDLIKD